MKFYTVTINLRGLNVKAKVRAESYEQAREKLLQKLNATEKDLIEC